MKHPKILLLFVLIAMWIANLPIAFCVSSSIQDANPPTTDSHQPASQLELLQKENLQLKDKLAWFETEYNKLVKLMALPNKRLEKHISPGGSPWLPFDSQEELEQAKQEAEAEAQKILDEQEANSPTKPKKRRKESLPQHLPVVKLLCDVPEADRICPKHGPMTMIGVDSTETLVYEPTKLYRKVMEYPKYGCSCYKSVSVHQHQSRSRRLGLALRCRFRSAAAVAAVDSNLLGNHPWQTALSRSVNGPLAWIVIDAQNRHSLNSAENALGTLTFRQVAQDGMQAISIRVNLKMCVSP